MNYIEIATQKTVTINHVRRAYPHLSLPDGRDYPELGFRIINPTPQPEALPNHYVRADFPIEVEGDWFESWQQVEMVPSVPEFPQMSSLEMLDLFTPSEQLAVVEATLVSPAVKLWYDRLIAATYVSYEDPRTEAGLQALVGAALLTQERKDEIVAAMQPATL